MLPITRSRTPTIRRSRTSSKRRSTDGRIRANEQNDVKKITSFTDEELNEFHQVFDFYDVGNTKTMDLGNLEKAVEVIGYNKKPAEMKELLLLLDVDGDTTVDFSEFCIIIDYIKHMTEEFEELKEAFKRLDHSDDGSVKSRDLMEMMLTKANGMSLKDVTEMMRFSDSEKTGRIQYLAFIESLKMFRNKTKRGNVSSFTKASDLSKQECNNKEEIDSMNDTYKKTQKKSQCYRPRDVETVDTVLKAIGGPILLTSAIIIQHT